MDIAYLSNSIPIPKIAVQQIRRKLRADDYETCGGALRRTMLGMKPVRRSWELKCSKLTQAQYKAIMNHLDSIDWTATTFWLDEFGGTPESYSIQVLVSPGQDERISFGGSQGWEKSGRNLSLIITER
jgi:hypothetical protein